MAAKKKKIIVDLLRHGEPEGGEVLRGRVDHALTELGWEQMRLSAGLGNENSRTPLSPDWTHIISSPLKRCRQFAEQLSAGLGIDLAIIDQWQEIDYGDWDGMPLREWRSQAAGQFREFRKDLSKLAPPNGEDYLSFRDRVLAAWQAITELEDGSHVLLVTHGGVLRVVLPTVLGMALNRSNPLHIPFACLSRVSLEIDEQGISSSLLFHNAAEYPSS